MGKPFRITQLSMCTGNVIEPADVTVFIGANNCGKSRTLNDLVLHCRRDNFQPKNIAEISISGPSSWTDLCDGLVGAELQVTNYTYNLNYLDSGLNTRSSKVSKLDHIRPKSVSDYISEQLSSDRADAYLRGFLPAAIAHLRTDTRLSLLTNTTLDGNRHPDKVLKYLYKGGTSLDKQLAAITREQFGLEVRLDHSDIPKAVLRCDTDFSGVSEIQRDSIDLLKSKAELMNQGDGIRAFTTVAIALEVLRRNIVVIDEPEAFLHPPQAYQLGKIIAQKAAEDSQFFLATHSAAVLRGIVEHTKNVKIIRIDRAGDRVTFYEVDKEVIQEIDGSPLLSSARVLEGLFSASAIVVESDSDARFFLSALHRYSKGLDVHAVAADNKQTVAHILKLYSRMGVRAVGIVDFDMLRKADELQKAMEQLGVLQDDQNAVLRLRTSIAKDASEDSAAVRLGRFKEVLEKIHGQLQLLEGHESEEALCEKVLSEVERRAQEAAHVTKPWNHLKQKGRNGLTQDNQRNFDSVNDSLQAFGLVIFPFGELESALVEFGLDYTTNKKEWISHALLLIRGLQVDTQREFWKFIETLVNDHIKKIPTPAADALTSGVNG